MDFLSDQFSPEDDLILSQIADMYEDNSEEIMCSQVQAVENQYFEDLELSQAISEMLAGLPMLPDVNAETNFSLKFEPDSDNLQEVKLEGNKSSSDTEGRFAVPVGDNEIQKLLENQQNANTRKNTIWAYNVFSAWRKERGSDVPNITEMDATALQFWLSRFVVEARKQDGSEYPAKSVYYLVCGLLRFLRDRGIYAMNFLDEKDIRFANFRKVLDSRMKELVSSGIGTTVKQADVILPEHEEKLWETGTFGDHSAESLQYTVYYYSCKIFGLRAYDEHRALECSQFTVGKEGGRKYVRFVGRSSKTYKGGLAQKEVKTKDIKHYCAEGKIFGSFVLSKPT